MTMTTHSHKAWADKGGHVTTNHWSEPHQALQPDLGRPTRGALSIGTEFSGDHAPRRQAQLSSFS